MKHPIPIVAAILSFFIPGLGHVYTGYMAGGFYNPLGKATIKKGFYFAGGYLLAAALTSVIIGFLLLPIVYIWNIVNAYCSAKRLRVKNNVFR